VTSSFNIKEIKKYVLDKIISEKLAFVGTWYVIDRPEK